MAEKYLCQACSKQVTATKAGKYRYHFDDRTEKPCEQSQKDVPDWMPSVEPGADPGVPVEGVDFSVCPQCERKVKLTRLGLFEPHETTLKGGERCPVSGVRAKHARRREDVLLPGDVPASPVPAVKDSSITSTAPTSKSASAASFPKELLPASGTDAIDWSDVEPGTVSSPSAPVKIDWSKVGDLKHLPESAPSADSGASTETSSPESETTSSPSSDESTPYPTDTFSLGVSFSERLLQPWSPFLQPEEWIPPTLVFLQPPAYEGPERGEPMGDLAKELATKIKETFYAYSNRKSVDNRSAQTTLGPSEIGTPCDRRLAMSLIGVPAVNAGGDGWAAFVGTCTHEGMAEVYTFADAGTGRYAVELKVQLGSAVVPRGTTDLLDRRDGTIVDWKVMGAYSLKKFKLEGPSPTYRTQAHVYGYGVERSGEKVRNVAIVGLPRAGSSLDEMHIWTEKYDRRLAVDALQRVERIAKDAFEQGSGPRSQMDVARDFPAGDDCRYCPFFLKKDEDMERGCPGK